MFRAGCLISEITKHFQRSNEHFSRESVFGRVFLRQQESQMPKLKTKSGAKKRFKITGTGKVLYQQSGKRATRKLKWRVSVLAPFSVPTGASCMAWRPLP